MQTIQQLAAVDLGSNSFRLEIGTVKLGQYRRTQYLKETIRQGNGLDGNSHLTLQAMQRGWDCLARFGEQIRDFAADNVRAVATQTLREARNRDEFLATGNRLLGFPIQVISGEEEARLIYQGVAQNIATNDERRLVMDIGGRSTELILGRGQQALQMVSCPVGSVAWSMQHFASGEFTATAFEMAEKAARLALAPQSRTFGTEQWDRAYGSAGTVNAVVDVLTASGWPEGHVTRAGLDWLLAQLLTAHHVDYLQLPGMREDRKPIIGGGLSVLRAVFELLGISRLEPCAGGLRHGLLMEIAQKKAR